MLRIAALAGLVFATSATTAEAQSSPVGAAVEAGILACSKWVLEPKTWSTNETDFANAIGLAERLRPIGGLPPGVLPEAMSAALDRFWILDAGSGNGVFVAASSSKPVCNVIGGGASDYEPEVEGLLVSPNFTALWTSHDHHLEGDMVTDTYMYATDKKAQFVVSRADQPAARTDRVQFLATLFYEIGNF